MDDGGLPPRLPMSVGVSLRDKNTQSLRETPTSTALPPFAALCRPLPPLPPFAAYLVNAFLRFCSNPSNIL